ncbi:MAG: hypothetical protein C4557_01100 [Anaerolineaceae bacterium]|jgi:hypothetical protein|nr:MAG: hypothetical protein C4557_01100 [Anaerolineaceae bacterium]
MTGKNLLAIFILIALTISACGSAEPEMSAEDIANTAVAEAWLAITQTALAAPSPTPIPPTFTPEPTATLLPTLPPLPTLALETQAAVSVPTQDECNQVPPIEPQGGLANVEFTNRSEGNVNLSFGMNTPNDKGECVTYTFTFGVGGQLAAKVLAGCYWGWAWIEGKQSSIARTGSVILCMTDPNVIYHIEITKERVDFE